MKVTRCDRCGKEIEKYSINITIEFVDEREFWDCDQAAFQKIYRILEDADLCVDCALELCKCMKREG